jgi:hypothetical protein
MDEVKEEKGILDEIEEAENQAVAEETASESSSSAAPQTAAGGTTRDLMVSTLVHLMGLPTGKQLEVLETKVDAVASKLTTLSLKLDRLAAQEDERDMGSVLDRIDLQIADLRTLIKKVLPRAMVSEGDLVISDEDMLGHDSQNDKPAK